jgi:hypothetical protein
MTAPTVRPADDATAGAESEAPSQPTPRALRALSSSWTRWERFAATPIGGRLASLLPLVAVLVVQTALAYRLQNTAFEDEALYVYAGHREWALLLHGTPTYDGYPSYFSGLPFLYPIAAAGFDYLGGLEAVRLFSLLLMLAATVLVWSVARRLYGKAPAILAAAFFGTCAPTLFLSRLATYDSTAIFLLAVGLWTVVRTARRNPLFILLAAPPIVLAIGVKYASALYLPTLLAVAVLAVPYAQDGTLRRPWTRGLIRAGLLGAAVVGTLALGYAAAPPDLRLGLTQTTTHRDLGGDPASALVRLSLVWCGWLVVLAVIGVVGEARSHRRPHAATAGPRTRVALAGVLTASALLATAYQVHIHQMQSLHKHIGFGLLFAAPVAGLAASRLSRLTAVDPRRRLPGLALGLAVVLAWYAGHAAAPEYGWPNSGRMVSALRPLTREGHYRYLAEENEVPRYYLRDSIQPYEWLTTFFFSYPAKNGQQLTGPAAYDAAIADHYFDLVVLDFGPTAALDKQLTETLARPGSGYHLAATVPAHTSHGTQDYYIWVADTAVMRP